MEDYMGTLHFGRRRSARIMSLQLSRPVEHLQVVPQEEHALEPQQYRGRKRGRKKKVMPISELADNPFEVDVKEKVDLEENDESFNKGKLSKFPLSAVPEEEKLVLFLNVLQEKDSTNIFAQPVDTSKVEGYLEVIANPMDLGTVRRKLQEGKYTTLEQFERDAFFTFDNALEFNGKKTIYYQKAAALRALSEKMLYILRTDPVHFMSRILKLRQERAPVRTCVTRPVRKAKKDKARDSGSRIRSSSNAAEDKRSNYRTRESYISHDESTASTVYNSTQQLVYVNKGDFSYKESLTNFAKGLGPTAQKVAQRKIQEHEKRVEKFRRDRAAMPPPAAPASMTDDLSRAFNQPKRLSDAFGSTAANSRPDPSGDLNSLMPGYREQLSDMGSSSGAGERPLAELGSGIGSSRVGFTNSVSELGSGSESHQAWFRDARPVPQMGPHGVTHQLAFSRPPSMLSGAQSGLLGPQVPRQVPRWNAAPVMPSVHLGGPSELGSIADGVGVGPRSWSQPPAVLDMALLQDRLGRMNAGSLGITALPSVVVRPTRYVMGSVGNGSGASSLPGVAEPSNMAHEWRSRSHATGASSSGSSSREQVQATDKLFPGPWL